METRIAEIAERIRGLRDIMDFSIEEMAIATKKTPEEYTILENGEDDLSINFICNCAEKFGVDIVELLTGENPHLSFYTIVKNGKGLPIKRRTGFKYHHLGATLKNKLAEPFLVHAPFVEEDLDKPIHLSHHEGQEFDYVIKGTLKCVFEDHVEILNEGDSAFYDSSHGHGMIAVDGEECVFLAILFKKPE